MAENYEPSGLYAPQAIVVFPLITAGVSMILALPYGFFCWHNPVVYLGLIFPFIYGGLVSYISSFLAFKVAPVRSPLLSALLAILGILPGYFLYVFVWLDYYRNMTPELGYLGPEFLNLSWNRSSLRFNDLFDFFLNYSAAFKYLSDIQDYGFRTIGDYILKGTPYKLLWLAEFAVIVSLLAWRFYQQAKRPYCEEQGIYYDRIKFPNFIKLPEDQDKLLDNFSKGEYGYIMVGALEHEKKYSHLEVELYCLEDLADGYLSVYLVKKSSKESKRIKVIDAIGIPQIQVDQLNKRLS